MVDFSSINSLDAALRLCETDRLVKTLLLPVELGGQNIPENVVFIPPNLIEAKDSATAELIDAVHAGMIEVAIIPEYRGASFVPHKILITAAYPGKSPEYELEIGIW